MDSRDRVVEEMVNTERKYVQDLETLQEYMRALEREEIVSKDVIHNLFLNLNNLVDFQRRFLIRVETQNDRSSKEQNWGSLFVQYVRGPEEEVLGEQALMVQRKNRSRYMNRMRQISTRRWSWRHRRQISWRSCRMPCMNSWQLS